MNKDCLIVFGLYSEEEDSINTFVIDNATKEIIVQNKLDGGTQNLAELIAICDAVNYFDQFCFDPIPVYSQSQTAIGWFKRKKYYSVSALDDKNIQDEIITSAFLSELNFDVLKWDTHSYGKLRDYCYELFPEIKPKEPEKKEYTKTWNKSYNREINILSETDYFFWGRTQRQKQMLLSEAVKWNVQYVIWGYEKMRDKIDFTDSLKNLIMQYSNYTF
jgi:hypothetical protein